MNDEDKTAKLLNSDFEYMDVVKNATTTPRPIKPYKSIMDVLAENIRSSNGGMLMFRDKHKDKEYDLHVERRETTMASYELTLHGISEKPFKITFKANRENADVLDTLNQFSEIVDRALKLQSKFNCFRYFDGMSKTYGVNPYEMREKLYREYIKLLRPEIKLVSSGVINDKQEEQDGKQV